MICSLTSCGIKHVPDLADIQGDHVHKEEVDIYFGNPKSCTGTDKDNHCVYHYKGEILHSEGGKAYPTGKYTLEAIFDYDHLRSYKIKQR